LVLDHQQRLGAKGIDEIKNHKFFQGDFYFEINNNEGIDWKNLRHQQPPIIPEQKSATDTTNFVRLTGKITDKEKEDFFAFIPRNSNSSPDMVNLFLCCFKIKLLMESF